MSDQAAVARFRVPACLNEVNAATEAGKAAAA
jgi:hypothetical protein